MTRNYGPESRDNQTERKESFVRPGFFQKITRVRAITDHRNVEYNPKTRVFAIVELITEEPASIPKTDVLITSGLLRFMPGTTGNQSVRDWIIERQTKIKALASQNPRDYKTDAFDLFEETQPYGESAYLAESAHLMSGFFSDPSIREADIAVRLMYLEAEQSLQDEQAQAAASLKAAQDAASLVVAQSIDEIPQAI
jgi:hypothetical protein